MTPPSAPASQMTATRRRDPLWTRRDRPWTPEVSRVCALLVLLRERPSHGYELAERLSSIGIDARLGQSMYRLLHDIERQGLAQSAWDLSQSGGPPRRIYTISEAGERFLAEATPELVRQRDALDAVLARFGQRSAAG